MDMANCLLCPCHMRTRHRIFLGHGYTRVPAVFYFMYFLNNRIRPGYFQDTTEILLGHACQKKKTQPITNLLPVLLLRLCLRLRLLLLAQEGLNARSKFIFPPFALLFYDFCPCVLRLVQLLFKIFFYKLTFYYSFFII